MVATLKIPAGIVCYAAPLPYLHACVGLWNTLTEYESYEGWRWLLLTRCDGSHPTYEVPHSIVYVNLKVRPTRSALYGISKKIKRSRIMTWAGWRIHRTQGFGTSSKRCPGHVSLTNTESVGSSESRVVRPAFKHPRGKIRWRAKINEHCRAESLKQGNRRMSPAYHANVLIKPRDRRC